MKKIYLFLFVILSTLSITSCQQDDLNDNIGYLRIEVGTNAYVDTRIAADYNPKQIALQILDSKGGIVESTDDWETLSGQQIRLEAGTYTVPVSVELPEDCRLVNDVQVEVVLREASGDQTDQGNNNTEEKE